MQLGCLVYAARCQKKGLHNELAACKALGKGSLFRVGSRIARIALANNASLAPEHPPVRNLELSGN